MLSAATPAAVCATVKPKPDLPPTAGIYYIIIILYIWQKKGCLKVPFQAAFTALRPARSKGGAALRFVITGCRTG